jgi:para-nitrobenzyl esterase
VRQWSHVRSYTVKDGHLYLSLMAAGGVYEFEPADAAPR